MRTNLMSVALLVSVAFSQSAYAGWYTGSIWRMQFIGTQSNLIVYVNASNHECGSTVLQIYDPNASGNKYVYAALLAWQAQGKVIQFLIEGCVGTNGRFDRVEAGP